MFSNALNFPYPVHVFLFSHWILFHVIYLFSHDYYMITFFSHDVTNQHDTPMDL